MNAPSWLRAAVQAAPARFGLLAAAQALPGARLRGPRGLALAGSEVEGVAADGAALHTAVLGLAGPQSPLPAGLAHELAALEPGSAAAGLLGLIEERLLGLLIQAQVRRAVDDPAGHRAALHRLAGPLDDAEAAIAGRLCDGRSADAMAARLARTAGCAVRIAAATGGSLPAGPGCSEALGGAALGVGQVVGRDIAAPELGCRIELGPVDPAAAESLRPGGGRHGQLLAALDRGLPPCLRWELVLLVVPAPARPCGLGELGRGTRLDGPPPAVEREILARSAG